MAQEKITLALTAHGADMGEVEKWLKVVDRTYNAHCKLIFAQKMSETQIGDSVRTSPMKKCNPLLAVPSRTVQVLQYSMRSLSSPVRF